MVEYAIGIDLGGTEIKGGTFEVASGELLTKASAPTRDGESVDAEPAFVAEARGLLDRLQNDAGGEAVAVGVSAPGLAAADGRSIDFMPPGRLDGLAGLCWGRALGREGEVPVLNDAHAAILGESWRGAAQGRSDVVMLTLGTGVGGAVLSGGKLLRGNIGRAGHLGHMTVDFEGTGDLCGTPGSLEDAIGNATLGTRCAGRYATTHDLVAAFAAGDSDAEEVWLRSLRALAAAAVSLFNIVDPSALIIGGGIAKAGDHLFGPLEKLIREREWQPTGARVELLPAQLGHWAGAYGAAYNAINNT